MRRLIVANKVLMLLMMMLMIMLVMIVMRMVLIQIVALLLSWVMVVAEVQSEVRMCLIMQTSVMSSKDAAAAAADCDAQVQRLWTL